MNKKNELSDGDIHQRTKQSVIWFTTLPFIMHLLRFASSLVLARILNPSDFGIAGIISVIIFYSDALCNFGLSRAVIQRKSIEKEHYESFIAVTLMTALVFVGFFQFSASAIADFYNEPLLVDGIKAFTVVLLISAVCAAPQAKLKRELKFKALAIIESVKSISLIVVSLSLALNDFGFWSLLAGTISSVFVGLVLTVIAAGGIPKPWLKMEFLMPLVHYGKWDFLNGQAKMLAENIDKLIIGKVLGTAQLGFYDKSLSLAKMPFDQLTVNMANVSFSSFSRLQDNAQELLNYLTKFSAMNAVLVIPLLVGLNVTAESFVLTVLGEKWSPMIESLELFAFSFIVAAVTQPITAINFATRREKQQSLINTIVSAVLIVTLLLVAKYGIVFIVYSILILNVVRLLWSFGLLKTYMNLSLMQFLYTLFPAIFCSALMWLSITLMTAYVQFDSVATEFLSSVALGAAVYIVLIFVLPFSPTIALRNKVTAKWNNLTKK